VQVGVVEDLLATGSNDVYVVRTVAGKELLVPAVKDIVLEINPAGGYIRIKDPAEWSDDED
jgi:16S rRNA processing protein RimM